MKAVVTIEPKHSVIAELPMPEMNDDCVRIKNRYCGVCCSEHYDWAHAPEGRYGHEPMGIIDAVGANVTGYKVGDRVCGLWGSGLPGAGAMVEYSIADPRVDTIIRAPEGLNDLDLIVEPLSCMMSAVSKMRCSMPGAHVCVVGCGYMGCGVISLLKVRGCHVVAVDKRESSLADALRYGANEALLPEDALEKYIRSGENAGTLDAGFEMVTEWGECSESLNLAAQLVKKCGQLCVGAYHTGPGRMVDMQLLGVKAIDVLNTHPREEDLNRAAARRSVEMLARGTWNYRNIPTMVYPMSRFDQAQADLETKYGRYMKAVINLEMADGEPYLVNAIGG